MNNAIYPIGVIAMLLLCPILLFSQISISGNSQTDDGNNVKDVTVTISGVGISTMTTTTDINGNFSFNALPDNQEYKICMDKATDPINGVTTFDLVLESKHILNDLPLNSPYKIIAADVSNNRIVSVLDMTLIRKLILSVIPNFPDAPSWRFIPANHVFSDPTDPFAAPYPERCQCVSANGNITGVDFIAVKMADLNYSAVTN